MFSSFASRLRWPLLGAAAGALVLVATTALAGSGVGGVVNLGQLNTVDAQTTLSGNPGGNPQLKLVNGGTNAAIRADSQTGIGINGVSVSGTGQQGQSQTGIGLLGIHADSTGLSAGVEGRTSSTDPNGAGVVGRNTGGGPGLRAIVNAGAPPLAVNSNVKVGNLNADLLDGLDSSALQKRVTGTCSAGQAIRIVKADGTVTCEPVSLTGAWSLTGNAGTTPGTNFLGTTDNQPLELKVNGQRGLRLEPSLAPNIIGGWSGNTSLAAYGATIGGGGCPASLGCGVDQPNKVTNIFGTVGGGYGNSASNLGTVSGGTSNTAGTSAAVGGGQSNSAIGSSSTIPGGAENQAPGLLSFAAGFRAQALHQGAFVWADSQGAPLPSPGPDTFTARANSGYWFGGAVGPPSPPAPPVALGRLIDTSTGAGLSLGGTWDNASDRALKRGFRPVSTRAVLETVASMPISSWSYKAEDPTVRHIGPTAQDFYKAFGLGLDDKHISTVDEGGVALAAIQGLYRQNHALHDEVARLRRANGSLRSRVDAQGNRLSKLEHAVSVLSR